MNNIKIYRNSWGACPLVTAPHASFDLKTGDIAKYISENLRWNGLVFDGFRTNDRVNVNRPTNFETEKYSSRAIQVHSFFDHLVLSLIPNGYVEIHGNGKFKRRIEIAVSSSVDPVLVHNCFVRNIPRQYDVAVEGIEDIYFKANKSDMLGTLGRVSSGIHIELPLEFRKNISNWSPLAKSINELYLK